MRLMLRELNGIINAAGYISAIQVIVLRYEFDAWRQTPISLWHSKGGTSSAKNELNLARNPSGILAIILCLYDTMTISEFGVLRQTHKAAQGLD